MLELKPLTRVEGHGTVRVIFDGKRAQSVELALTESPRLFEALLLGRSFAEVPEIICRICSICSTIHRVTALQAVEDALALGVSEQTRLYRELIVNGGQIASHALHLYCLTLPDYYCCSGFSDLAVQAPEEVASGLRLKAAGNRIQEVVGGRLIHPVNLVPGGMGKPVPDHALEILAETLLKVLEDAVRCCRLFAAFPPPSAVLSQPHRQYLTVQGEPARPLFGTRLATGDGRTWAVADFRQILKEEVVGHSLAKQSLVGGEAVTVGALARLNGGRGLSPLAAKAVQGNREWTSGNIFTNNLSQAVELLHAVERSLEIIFLLRERGCNDVDPLGRPVPLRFGTGSSATEAPRGVLIHSYCFDSRGICTGAEIITPTAINQAAMEADLLALAQALEGAPEDELKVMLERMVRAYDPCISCAVHLVR